MINRVSLSTPVAVLVWIGLVTAIVWWAVTQATVAAAVFAAASLLLWASGLRAAAVWLRATAVVPRAHVAGDLSASRRLRTALLYCVADDADLAAIARSMAQDVETATVILDDSRTAQTRARIDGFAAAHGCRVLRRTDRRGYKAGNLNHAVAVLRGEFDAYLVCDSDVVLPPHFARVCAEALADPRVAVAQGAPDAGRGRTRFAAYFGGLLGTHLAITRRGRGAQGISAFLGRGALVRASAIDEVGGFPEAVAEDTAMTVALRRRGWRLVDVDATFVEDYPVDYRAFRTQLRKTAEGAVEFLRRPLRGLPLRERLDVRIETAMLPVGAVAGAIALVAGAGLAAAGSVPPVWAMALSGASSLVPLLPEARRRARRIGLAAGVTFTIAAAALYASAMFVVLAAVLRTALGRRAVFWITPKSSPSLDLRGRLAMYAPELLMAPALGAAAVLASGSAMSALAPLGPLLLAVAFGVPLGRASRGRRAWGDRRPVSVREPRLVRS